MHYDYYQPMTPGLPYLVLAALSAFLRKPIHSKVGLK